MRRKALAILWVFLIKWAKRGQDTSAAALTDGSSACESQETFPQLFKVEW